MKSMDILFLMIFLSNSSPSFFFFKVEAVITMDNERGEEWEGLDDFAL